MDISDLQTIPSNYAAETALLACIINDNDLLYEIEVTEDMFFDSKTRNVWNSIQWLVKERKHADLSMLYWAVKEELKEFIYELVAWDYIPFKGKLYAQEIQEKYIQRKIIKFWKDISVLWLEYSNMDKIRSIASSVLMEWWDKDIRTFMQVYQNTLDSLWRRWDKIADFGYKDLDKLKGYIEWNMIVIGARPKVGKSTFVINLMKLLSYQSVKSCLYSLEMTKAEVSERFVSMLSETSWILLDHIDEERKQEVTNKCLSRLDVIESIEVVDDIFTFSKMYVSIRKKASEWFKVFFIDYLQLIEWEWSNANERISKITKYFKRIAQELSICIVVLSQLNREWADWKPQLQHLRDSWAIEQDANLVMLLSMDRDMDNILCVDVAANRAWPTLMAELKYLKNIYTITD